MSHLFLLQIYTEWYILIGFSYNSKLVCFRTISMSFLNLLSQKKHIPVNFQDQKLLETEVIKEKVELKMCHFAIY